MSEGPPSFILEACNIFSDSPNQIYITPDSLRKAKKNEMSETWEKERNAFLFVLIDILFESNENQVDSYMNCELLIEYELKRLNYPRLNRWNTSNQELLFTISWICVKTQYWRHWSIKHAFELIQSANGFDSCIDVVKASIINNNKNNTMMMNSTFDNTGDTNVIFHSNLIAQRNSYNIHGLYDTNNDDPHVIAAESVMERKCRIQHKLKLLRSLDKQRLQLVDKISNKITQINEDNASKSNSSNNANTYVSNIESAKVAKRVVDEINTHIDMHKNTNLSTKTKSGTREYKIDIDKIVSDAVDHHRSSVDRINSFLRNSHENETKFWNWICSADMYVIQSEEGEEKCCKDGDSRENQRKKLDFTSHNNSTGSSGSSSGKIQDADIDDWSSLIGKLEYHVLALLTRGTLRNRSRNITIDDDTNDPLIRSIQEVQIEICNALRSNIGETDDKVENEEQMNQHVEERTRSLIGGVATSCLQQHFETCPFSVEANLTALREQNKQILDRVLNATSHACPYSIKACKPGHGNDD